MVDVGTLKVGGIYAGRGPRRAITQVSGDMVEYAEEHSLSYAPLLATREDFAQWAERETPLQTLSPPSP